MSRVWQAQEGETSRAFSAFGVYRDLGATRTLREAANLFYGGADGATPAQHDQMRHWSSRHSWGERVRAYDSWLDMERREYLREHLAEKARDHAERESRLRERSLELREMAGNQAELMLKYPITRQERVVEGGPDGGEVTYVFAPAGWSKATAVAMHNMMVGNAGPTAEEIQESGEMDVSDLSEEELAALIAAQEKIRWRPTPRG